MISKRDLKGLLQPLLLRRSDVVYDRGFLLIVPFSHYARGVAFTASRFGKHFEAYAFASQLFGGYETLLFQGNEGQVRSRVPESWAERLEQAAVELCDNLEARALPAVAPILNPFEHEKRHEYMPMHFRGQDPLTSPTCAFAIALGACFYGDYSRAERIMSALWVDFTEYPPESTAAEHRYHSLPFWRMAYLLQQLRTDRAGLPQLLHDWEADTVTDMKLTRYWTPTPFPCETP